MIREEDNQEEDGLMRWEKEAGCEELDSYKKEQEEMETNTKTTKACQNFSI